MKKPIIGITIGDPSGVGPEISLKALENREVMGSCVPVLYGDARVLEKAASIVGSGLEVLLLEEPGDALEGRINLVSLEVPEGPYKFAAVQGECGQAAFAYIKRAIEDAMEHKIDAVVTGPINKEALNAGGINYSGHTEIFADLTKTKDYAMLLTGGGIRVIHVSTHVALREACDRAKKERIGTVIRLADSSARGLGVRNPRVAVAGLNPHSGEGGLFGREEIEEIIPAIEEAKSAGFDVTGPVPPDTVFVKLLKGDFDIVVAMYHDQGHIPLKLTDFMGGVNITVGLPIIRTSVDHGTAFGKAGKGTADESSMVAAVGAAIQLSLNRR